MRLDSFFSGALCVLSGGRLPEALFMVLLLDSKGAKACKSCRSRQELSNEYFVFTYKMWLRYSRERASQSLPKISQKFNLEKMIKKHRMVNGKDANWPA